jgi:uncharacterized protein (DUF4415 family)
MNESKRGIQRASVDPEDAPELDDAFFERADEFVGERLVRRGRPPKSGRTKQLLSVRYDVEVIEAFRETGDGWQSRMNDALKQFLAEHPIKRT